LQISDTGYTEELVSFGGTAPESTITPWYKARGDYTRTGWIDWDTGQEKRNLGWTEKEEAAQKGAKWNLNQGRITEREVSGLLRRR